MTVSSTSNRKTFTGDAVTTSFATSPMIFFNSSELTVYVVTTATGAVVATLTENTHYTVTGGSGSTGTVNLAGGSSPYGAPAATTTLVIVRELPLTQAVDFVNNDGSDAEVAEDALDKLVMIAQQIDAKAERSFRLADSDVSGASTVLPTPEASTVIGWNDTATALVNYSAGELPADILVSSFMETVLDDANAAAARATLGFPDIAAKGDLIAGSADDTLTKVAVGTNGYLLLADSAQASGVQWAPLALQPGGRLTLETAVPVSTSDQSGKTTVYYTPYKHNGVQLYDGAGWIAHAFAELSQLTTDATKSPAAVASNSNYDVFVWNDSGTLRATRGPAWSSDTARGTGAGTTELEMFEGRYVNKNAITNGPAARRGLYVGTIRSNASSQINDSLALRHVWNTYNRVPRPMRVLEATDSWTYSTATWRQMNNSTANQLDFVRGLDEDNVSAMRHQSMSSSSGVITARVAIGLDVVNAFATGCMPSRLVTDTGTRDGISTYNGLPGLGRHFLAALEQGAGADTQTWYGDAGAPTNVQNGITGDMPA